MNLSKYLLVLIIPVLFSACAAVKPYYDKEHTNWTAPDMDALGEPSFTFFLIGDAGKPDLEVQEPTLKLLQNQLEQADDNSAVVFLGDNIYTYGMPPADHPEREKSEKRINESLKILTEYSGQVYFVPGNHDWYAKDTKPYPLAEEEAYIETYLGNDDVFIPEGGKQGPHVVMISDDIVMIAIDSYRWIRDLQQDGKKGEITPLDSLPNFTGELEEILLANKDKHIVLVDHHPPFTNGGHGGYFSWKDHIFPLRILNKKLYIPLPILGSILPIMRKAGASKEDNTNKYYKRFNKKLLELTKLHNNLVMASGHEHSLQYFHKQKQHFIVSGAGSKSSYLRKGKGMAFGHMHKGYSVLRIYPNGSTWVEYVEPIGDGSEGTTVFSWELVPGNK